MVWNVPTLVGFFENQRNKNCRHLSEKASKGRFLDKLQSHTNEGKGKEKKKERKKERGGRNEENLKKAMLALLVSIMAILGKKKLLDTKGPFGGNVFKNPARHTGEGKLRKS